MVKTKGLYHLHLVVTDLDRSLRFYQSAFGMKELFRDGPHMVFLQTPGGSDLITLNGDPSLKSHAGPGSGGIEHFGFDLAEGQSLDAAIADIEEAGGKLEARSGPTGRQYAYLRDPDGYLIEI